MREIKFRVWNPNANKFVAYAGVNEMPLHEAGALTLKVPVYEILQYTGLKDKNGVEIYEGDIVREYDDYDGEPAIIDWNTDDACFRINYDGESDGFYNIDSTMIEVIGNIYENPELLEANQ